MALTKYNPEHQIFQILRKIEQQQHQQSEQISNLLKRLDTIVSEFQAKLLRLEQRIDSLENASKKCSRTCPQLTDLLDVYNFTAVYRQIYINSIIIPTVVTTLLNLLLFWMFLANYVS